MSDKQVVEGVCVWCKEPYKFFGWKINCGQCPSCFNRMIQENTSDGYDELETLGIEDPDDDANSSDPDDSETEVATCEHCGKPATRAVVDGIVKEYPIVDGDIDWDEGKVIYNEEPAVYVCGSCDWLDGPEDE